MKNKKMKKILVLLMLVLLISCAPADLYTSSNSSSNSSSEESTQRLDSSTFYRVFDVAEMGIRCVFVDGYQNGAMWCVDLDQ